MMTKKHNIFLNTDWGGGGGGFRIMKRKRYWTAFKKRINSTPLANLLHFMALPFFYQKKK